MAAIETKEVFFRYRATDVLHNITIALAEAEFTGIIGPNGAGKSTFLRIIGGILRNFRGSVKIMGEDISSIKQRTLASQIGFVAQETYFSLNFTVEEIITMGRFPYLKPFQRMTEHDHNAVEQAIVHAELAELRRRAINNLSSGERQRTVIARAIAQEPRILLLDEPTSHLDLHHQCRIMDLLRKLSAHGISVVTVNHDLNLAVQYCDHLVLMHEGKVHAQGAPDTIINEDTIRQVYRVECAITRSAGQEKPQVLLKPH